MEWLSATPQSCILLKWTKRIIPVFTTCKISCAQIVLYNPKNKKKLYNINQIRLIPVANILMFSKINNLSLRRDIKNKSKKGKML